MRAPLFALALFLLATVSDAIADPSKVVAAYDSILAGVAPEQTTIALGDMIVPVSTVRLWRDQLAGTAAPSNASQTGINKWTSGIVYYAFNANVSAVHRTATLDAMAEWAAFANLTFTPRVAETNYVMINEQAGLNGGNSAVGMIGGAQALNIGPTSWNRPTLCHELGHTLGLIHEHQRSDRDTYVTIAPAVAGDGNFILIPTSTNNGAYDFLSVMHYGKDTLGVGNITPKPDYIQYLNIMGGFGDRVLSRRDRDGMALVAMYGPGPATSTVVTNTKDSGAGALRTAIYKAFDVVTDTPAATPTVSFQIPNTDLNFAGGVFTITPTDRLPAPGARTTIDATTQTAFTGNTNASGPEVVLNGTVQSAEPSTYGRGLQIIDPNVTVRGLVIQAFETQGIFISGTGATGCTIAGCYIGTNAAGTAAVANTFSGIEIGGGATGNTIGGTTAAARNVISGNASQGIYILEAGTGGNFIQGNYIGTNAAGTAALANGFAGIEINGGLGQNLIGGTAPGAGNVLSGNLSQGVAIIGSQTNTLQGNFVGTNAAGTAAIPNGFAGVQIFSGGQFNVVGGSIPAARNILSGNTGQGAAINGATTGNNGIVGNYVGLNAAGNAAIPNGFSGVQIYDGATYNVIGGSAAGTGNVLSGNVEQGVAITASNNNTVAGNFIGTNAAGTAAIANGTLAARRSGVGLFSGASNNTIGGPVASAANLISGNTAQGILIANSGTNTNTVTANLIGLNATGTAAVANGYSGVEITGGAQNNVVGGTTPATRNVISGNTFQGVYLNGAGTSGNRVSGNYIGTNLAGNAAVANAGDGVEIYNGPTGSIIGGAAPGAGNVISGNANRNVLIIAASGNTVLGNLIGLNAAGTGALVNGGPGIQMWGGASGNTIGGTSGGRNFISGNTNEGLTISDSGTNANIVVGNSIGTTPGGAVVANSGNGISIFGGPQNNVIGGTAVGAANSISGNGGAGIAIYNASTANRISGNSITANNGLGIDFWNDGVTANDMGDGDTGPNNLQNFPVLNSAAVGVGTTISWTLNSTPNTTFRVEFFANATNDGEGQTFLGAASVTTNASGNPAVTPISTTLPAVVPANYYLTATATDPAGNTSEFSANRQVSFIDSEPDGLPDAYEIATWTNLTSAIGAGDSDGDGMTNAQEFRAGTNPRDPLSVFRLAPPVTAAADKTLSLANFAGRTYRIDYADILGSPTPWRILADQIPGTGSTITITVPGAAALPQRYYRAVVEP